MQPLKICYYLERAVYQKYAFDINNYIYESTILCYTNIYHSLCRKFMICIHNINNKVQTMPATKVICFPFPVRPHKWALRLYLALFRHILNCQQRRVIMRNNPLGFPRITIQISSKRLGTCSKCALFDFISIFLIFPFKNKLRRIIFASSNTASWK